MLADSLKISTGNNSSFSNLQNLTAQGIVSGAISLVLIVVALVLLLYSSYRWSSLGYFRW